MSGLPPTERPTRRHGPGLSRASVFAADRIAYTEAGATLFQLLRQLELSLPLLAQLPVSHGRMALLRCLALHGPLNLSEVARLRGVSRQGVQRLAELLEGEGLVRARSHAGTPRAKRLELTEAGARAYRELARQEARELNALAVGLSPAELRAATRVLRLLAERRRQGEPAPRSGAR